jgi:hypothetical protein
MRNGARTRKMSKEKGERTGTVSRWRRLHLPRQLLLQRLQPRHRSASAFVVNGSHSELTASLTWGAGSLQQARCWVFRLFVPLNPTCYQLSRYRAVTPLVGGLSMLSGPEGTKGSGKIRPVRHLCTSICPRQHRRRPHWRPSGRYGQGPWKRWWDGVPWRCVGCHGPLKLVSRMASQLCGGDLALDMKLDGILQSEGMQWSCQYSYVRTVFTILTYIPMANPNLADQLPLACCERQTIVVRPIMRHIKLSLSLLLQPLT